MPASQLLVEGGTALYDLSRQPVRAGPGQRQQLAGQGDLGAVERKNARIVLAAPTGRAAKRLTELTGHEAVTVHRLLELRPGGDAAYDKDRPLDADLTPAEAA